jgi:AraC-like DNA-binding protein
MPSIATAIPLFQDDHPRTANDVFQLFAEGRPQTTVERCPNPDRRVSIIKSRIDATYDHRVTLQDLAVDLSQSRVMMSRLFKRSFGLSPIDYRGRLRISKSASQLLFGMGVGYRNISDVGFDSGFEDLSRFNKEFKKFLNATPSQYRGPSSAGSTRARDPDQRSTDVI